MLTRSEVELQPLNWLTVLHIALYWLPALAPNPQYSPALAPYSPTQAPNNSVLHYKGYKRDNQIGSRITTPELAHSPTYSPALAPYPGSLHRLSASGSTSRGSHKKEINKTQIEIKIVF